MLLRLQTELPALQRKPAKQATEGYSCHFKECGTIYSGFAYQLRSEVPASSLNRIGKGTTQRYSGIGLCVSYRTCTRLGQHGCPLLLVTEPKTVDPGHQSMLCKDSNPLDSEVKDAYSIPFNQGRNIDNNDSCFNREARIPTLHRIDHSPFSGTAAGGSVVDRNCP